MPSKQLFYKTKHSYVPGTGREICTQESVTVPDQSFTIRELIDRIARGTEEYKPPSDEMYFDVDDIDHINEFFSPAVDLTDIDNLNEHVSMLKGALEKAKAAKAVEESVTEPLSDPEPKVAGKTSKQEPKPED